MTFAEKYARIVAFGVQSDSHCCKDFQAPKGIASECQSNCRSKLSMHLNSLFPEKDKDTKLQNRSLEDEYQPCCFFPPHFHYKAQVTLLSQLKNCRTFSRQVGVYFSCVNKCP